MLRDFIIKCNIFLYLQEHLINSINILMLTSGRRGFCILLTTCCCNRSYGILLHVVEGKTITQPLFLRKCIWVWSYPEYVVMMFINTYILTSIVQGWSFSDVMFVTKQNMANAVSTVSKQLENLHETLAVSSLYWLFTCLFAFWTSFPLWVLLKIFVHLICTVNKKASNKEVGRSWLQGGRAQWVKPTYFKWRKRS